MNTSHEGKTDFRVRQEDEAILSLLQAAERRRKTDPIATYVPSPGGQKEFIEGVLKRTHRENWFMAANRAGKSDAGAFIGASMARFGNQNARFVGGKDSHVQVRDTATSGWVVSLDHPTSRDVIQPKYFNNGYLPGGATHEPFIPAHEYDESGWSVTNNILRLRNGSIIGFKSADSGRTKFQGAEKDWVHFDEEPPRPVYEETVIRVGARPLTIFGTCTLLPPEGAIGGISWLFNDKVRPWKRGELPNVKIYTASIYDNPFILKEEIAALEELYMEGSIQYRIRLLGELISGATGSRVYSGFDSGVNMRDVGDIALRRTLAWMWDFNVEPMVTLIGQRDKGVFTVFAEIILEEGNIYEMCEAFKMVHPRHLSEVHIFGDASGRDRSHQTRQSSYQMILAGMRDYPAPLRLRVPQANPLVTDRINAVNRASRTEDGETKLLVSPNCAELIDDMEQVLSDGRGGIKKTYNRKDGYFRRSHTSDAMGYWVAQEAPVMYVVNSNRQRYKKIPMPRYGGIR